MNKLVIFAASEARNGAGFWSNESGWTTIDGATRFTLKERESLSLPMSAGGDARWISADLDGLTFFVLDLSDKDGVKLQFECFAEDFEHASEQAQDAYPGCQILSTHNLIAEDI